MLHPLQGDLSIFDDTELEKKISELNKKITIAHRSGNHQVLTQLNTFAILYKEEQLRRHQTRNKTDLSNNDINLDKLINID